MCFHNSQLHPNCAIIDQYHKTNEIERVKPFFYQSQRRIGEKIYEKFSQKRSLSANDPITNRNI